MDNAAELSNYLPPSYKSPKEQEYIAFLWDAFETNYTHEKIPVCLPRLPHAYDELCVLQHLADQIELKNTELQMNTSENGNKLNLFN